MDKIYESDGFAKNNFKQEDYIQSEIEPDAANKNKENIAQERIKAH